MTPSGTTIMIDSLSVRVESMEPKVDEVYRAIRGHDGTPGLVSDMQQVNTKIDLLSEDMTEVKRMLTATAREKKEETDDRHVSWSWIRDRLMVPVVTAFVVWFMLDVLPKLLGHLGP